MITHCSGGLAQSKQNVQLSHATLQRKRTKGDCAELHCVGCQSSVNGQMGERREKGSLFAGRLPPSNKDPSQNALQRFSRKKTENDERGEEGDSARLDEC